MLCQSGSDGVAAAALGIMTVITIALARRRHVVCTAAQYCLAVPAPPPKSGFALALDAFQLRFGTRQHQFVRVPIRRGRKMLLPLINAANECNSWIAGGAVRWMCSPNNDPVSSADVDIFPPDHERLLALESRLIDLGYSLHPRLPTDMARTYVHPQLPPPVGFVQLVVPRTEAHMNTSADTAEQLLSTLDFTIARAAIVTDEHALVDVDFERDERLRQIRVRHIVCPISSVRRIAKYTAKGYRCKMLEIIKLFAEWSSRAEAGAALPSEDEVGITPTQLLRLFCHSNDVGGDTEDERIDRILAGLYVD